MLTLQNKITLNASTIDAANLVDQFTDQDLVNISAMVMDGYNRDKLSRAKWERRTEAAMDLAMQIQKDKNFPWPNCSNVAFPLITIAVTQFHARAYPAIINGPELVKYKVIGSDPEGKEKARAERVGLHMSWQLMEQDTSWETQQDKLLINLAVVGSNFKKTYHSGTDGYNKGDLVMSKDLVLDYYALSVEDCPRKTHIIPLFRNEVYERVKLGTFKNILEEAWYKRPTSPKTTIQQSNADNRSGVTPPQPDETTPFIFLEQHTWVDLDQDGYAEPYLITVEQSSQCVVRIVCRFEQEADILRNASKEIIKIRAAEYFTKYTFIPSPDGGIYDMGFGVLLGPLNESGNSIINQLIDAGSMSVAGGGFLGRGAKIRGGIYSFQPFGWQRVDSSGDDLRKNIFPLPVREPSMVLFQLLTLLINYTNRISGSTDIMVGESVGQNTPADTARQMQQEGMKVYNAIFKRVWTSMKEEFRKIYILNAYFIPESLSFGVDGMAITRRDYLGDPTRVAPVADPNTSTQADRIAQATALKQAAMTTPGYNVPEVEKLYLKAIGIPNIEIIYAPDKFPPGEDIKIKLKQMDLEKEQMKLQAANQEFIMSMMQEAKLNDAQIAKLQAESAKIISEIGAEQGARQLEQFKSMVEMVTSRNEVLMQQIQHRTAMVQLATKQEDRNAKRESREIANSE